MNRYQSILVGLTTKTLQELRALTDRSEAFGKGYWYADNGKLWVQIEGETFEFTFESKDEESEAICLLLNNLRFMLPTFAEEVR